MGRIQVCEFCKNEDCTGVQLTCRTCWKSFCKRERVETYSPHKPANADETKHFVVRGHGSTYECGPLVEQR